MASLIDTLIDVLDKENTEYETLLELSMEKTGIIVEGNVTALNEMIVREQQVVERITALEKKRTETTNDIAMVLNRKPDTLTLEHLAELLAGQETESTALRRIHDKLKTTLGNMVRVNESNKQLLQESIDMADFEINIMQSMRQAPATANYSDSGYTGESFGAIQSVDWMLVASASVLSGVVSMLTSIAGLPEVKEDAGDEQ